MNIDQLVKSQFSHYMNRSWSDTESKCKFESLVMEFRKHVEAGEPFTESSHPYRPFNVAASAYQLSEYSKKETQVMEDLIRGELEKRGLLHAFLSEQTEYKSFDPGIYSLNGKRFTLKSELLPCDEFLGHPIYKHGDMTFTFEQVQRETVVGGGAPTNNVGTGNIAGVSPGQEPPGRRGKFFRRNLEDTKNLKKKVKKRTS